MVTEYIPDIIDTFAFSPGTEKVLRRCESGNSRHELEVLKLAIRMDFYGKKLGPKLSRLLENNLNNEEKHDISKEVAMVRTVGAQALGVYDALLEMPEGTLPEETRVQLIHDAGQIVADAMDESSRIVERSAKIFALTSDKLDPQAVDKVAKQICRFVYLCFEDFESKVPKDADIETKLQWNEFDEAVRKIMRERIKKFDDMLTNELQMPTLKQLGTTLSPDQQVRAMIDTVPFVD